MVALKKRKKGRERTPSGHTPLTAPPGWIRTSEAARLLGRSSQCVMRLGREGALVMNKPSPRSHALFRRDQVVAMAKANGLDVP